VCIESFDVHHQRLSMILAAIDNHPRAGQAPTQPEPALSLLIIRRFLRESLELPGAQAFVVGPLEEEPPSEAPPRGAGDGAGPGGQSGIRAAEDLPQQQR
jgi:hypothetical protein